MPLHKATAVCTKCGKLKTTQFSLEGVCNTCIKNKKPDEPGYREWMDAKNKYQKEYRERKKEKFKKYRKEWKERHPEKHKEGKKRRYERYMEKHGERTLVLRRKRAQRYRLKDPDLAYERTKIWRSKQVASASDVYMSILVSRSIKIKGVNLPCSEVPADILELYRKRLLISRNIKNTQNGK
jgi:hypothetical protein